MDEPTAALGVVQTRNVLDLIVRVKDHGLSVVLISHNMPEVLEVADRIEVLRLGAARRALRARRRVDGGHRRRDDGRAPAQGRCMSTQTTPPDSVEPERAAPAERPPWWRRLIAGSSAPIGLILVGLIVVFSVLEYENFVSVSNARNITTDAAVLLVLAVGSTFVIITAGIDLSVGSVLVFAGVVAAKAMEAVGGEGVGTLLVGLAAALASGLGLGRAERLPDREGEDPRADRHPGHAGHGARGRPADHRWRRPARRPVQARRDRRLRAPVRRAALPRADRLRRRAGGRHPARRHALRPLHVRDRLERGGRAPCRRRRRPSPDQGLRARRHALRPRRLPRRSRASRPPRSAATRPTTSRRSPRS